MITGLSADNARPIPQQTAKRKTDQQDDSKSQSSFEDQLLGARSEEAGVRNRKDRNDSGRDRNREEVRSSRSDESEHRSYSDLREKQVDRRRTDDDERVRPKDDEQIEERVEDRAPQSIQAQPLQQHVQNAPTSSPASDDEAPIVIENPKGKDSQELKLPDFFSKAALQKGAGKVAAKGVDGKAAAELEAMKENEGLTRQQAMEKFVNRMQSELGIPPEKLLAAFAKLDDKAMMQPPEQSKEQFLAALDLNAQDEAKAGALYSGLLKTTGDSLLNEHLAGLDGGVNFDVMSPRDAAMKKLNDSLEDLNKSFFRKENPKQAQKDLESMDLALAKLMNPQVQQQAQTQQQQPTDAQAGAQEAALIAALGQAQIAPAAEQEGEDGLGDMMANQKEMVPSKAGGKSALENAFAKEMSKAIKEDDKETEVETKDVAQAKVDPNTILDQGQPQAAASPLKTAVMGPADMMMGKQPTAQDEQDNVKELIKQAQVMVKRGGGEMKMEMKPEGMGAIQLRVNVENGKVNVQMLTESETAKHLLEKGLSELKTNLAAHELKVQSMTVDVGNDVKNQMDQKASQEQARQHARQMASDFMGNFRDEQQGFRQGFMDNKGWRQYGRSKGPESLEPAQVERAARAMRSDNNKRLNLVA